MQVIQDLLAMLKHSEGNRDAFISALSWHTCMYTIMSQLIASTTPQSQIRPSISTHEIPFELEHWDGTDNPLSPFRSEKISSATRLGVESRCESRLHYCGNTDASTASYSSPAAAMSPKGKLLRGWGAVGCSDSDRARDEIESGNGRHHSTGPAMSSSSPFNSDKRSSARESSSNPDVWFAIGMKIYATLLGHALLIEGGWRDVERTISQAFHYKSLHPQLNPDTFETLSSADADDAPVGLDAYDFDDEEEGSLMASGKCVAQAVLSHVVSELTFSMRKIYSELSDLIRTKIKSNIKEADNRLENILSVIISAGQFALGACATSTAGVPDLYVGRLRVTIMKELMEEIIEHRYAAMSGTNRSSSPSAPASQTQTQSNTSGSSLNSSGDEITTPENAVRVAEDRLLSHMLNDPELSPDGPSSSAYYREGEERRVYLDFRHVWFDVAVATIAGTTSSSQNKNDKFRSSSGDEARERTAPPAAHSVDVSESRPRLATKKSRRSVVSDEILHPLERTSRLDDGRLTLVLQILRLFDSLFWLKEKDIITNVHLLMFTKDRASVDAELARGAKSGPSGGSLSGSPSGPTIGSQTPVCVMTLFSTTQRMCLFVLNNLSPLHPLAAVNLHRMKLLIRSAKDTNVLPRTTTPVNDWILAITLHLTLNLQRVTSSLSPIFQVLGISNPDMRVLCAGLETEQDARAELHRHHADGSVFDDLFDNPDMQGSLQGIVNGTAGKNLLLFAKIAMSILADLMDESWTRKILSQALEKDAFEALTNLVTRVNNYRRIETMRQLQKEEEKAAEDATAKAAATKAAHRNSLDKTSSAAASSSSSTPSASHRRRSSLSALSSWFSSPGSEGTESGGGGTGGRDERAPNNGSAREVGDNNFTTRSSETRSSSSSTFKREGSLSLMNESYTKNLDTCEALDSVVVLRLLRDPFVQTINLLRSPIVVKSLTSLESNETTCTRAFDKDMALLRSDLHQHQFSAFHHVEEASALKELSVSVVSLLVARERTRISSQRTENDLQNKLAASSWHNCLKAMETDWSPWDPFSHRRDGGQSEFRRGAERVGAGGGDDNGDDLQVDGIVRFELARACDIHLRRMILTKADQPRDHRNASYFETKQHVQQEHLESLRAVGGAHGERLDGHGHDHGQDEKLSDMKEKVKEKEKEKDALRGTNVAWFKPTAPLNAGGGGGWGDDEGVDIGDSETLDDRLEVASEASFYTATPTLRGTDIMGLDLGLGQMLMQAGGIYSEKRPQWTYGFSWASDERFQFEATAVHIQLQFRLSGELVLTNKALYFHPIEVIGGHGGVASGAIFKDNCWTLDRLAEMYGRRHLQKNCAIELFFVDAPELLFAFSSLAELQRFYNCLKRQQLPLVTPPYKKSLSPARVFQHLPWQDLWRRRLISNYEYLMRLNIISGRSWNDVSQYPVMPWILADYKSQELDLSNPATFRDLSKPMGALDPERLKYFIDRYNSFDADSPLGPPFFFGSHYSTEGFVVHYMLRQEPFTTLGVNLQGGRFDCPDRLFFDLSRTWEGCSKQSVSDVKELIPEFFCCPEMLINTNRLPLGELQEGGEVGDVVLPPWAANPYEFIRIHREALESEYVSAHLHEWIDLIFGYKQKGAAAKEAFNVFHYLTYENAVDIDSIEDEGTKAAVQVGVIML